MTITTVELLAGITPGPWKYVAGEILAVGMGPRAGKIADISIAFKDSATRDANARLIAAAPTLISNLVKALEPFAKIANHCEGEPDDTVLYTHQGLMGDYPLTIGDFRNVAKALRSNLDKEEGDDG